MSNTLTQMSFPWVFTYGIDSEIPFRRFCIHAEIKYTCTVKVHKTLFFHCSVGKTCKADDGNSHPVLKRYSMSICSQTVFHSKFTQINYTYGWWPRRQGTLRLTNHSQSVTLTSSVSKDQPVPLEPVCWFISLTTDLLSSVITWHSVGNRLSSCMQISH